MPEQNPLLAELNPPQKQAVISTKGPALILAGAGSGKTRALTHRIAYLMANGVQPWNILAVTFTNKAATEMKERIAKLLKVEVPEGKNPFTFSSGKLPVMGTFHSICARILRREMEHLGRDKSFVIYDKDDQLKVLKQILKAMQVDENDLKPKVVSTYIGRFKCEALTPKQALPQATTARMLQIVKAYELYQKELKAANALDFDDILLETVRLFTEHPKVLEHYQDTWQYIHVDEYQDTNHVQYLLITLLAKKHLNLCVIGDPDQSIYAFRGADIRNILEFQKEYKDALSIKLEQNYRSTQTILDAASSVIAINPDRPEKTMWTDAGKGEKIILHEVSDEKREAREALETVKQYQQKGVALNDQVILYRTNAQSRLLEEACLRSGIAYRMIGGVKFYARKEVKDTLAYLQAVLNPYDSIALLRIINIPSRKIGATTLSKIQEYAQASGMSVWDALVQIQSVPEINTPTKARIQEFVSQLQQWQQLKNTLVVAALADKVISQIKLEPFIRDDTEEGETRWQNIQELVTVMHKYDGLEPEVSLLSFLEEVALISEVDALQSIDGQALTLMTLHLCKGLEYEHVIVVGCEEGIFPHSNAMFDKSQLEEECRLMYVGMTRAKKYLTLMHANSRNLWGEQNVNAPSRFLDEIPDALLERRSDSMLSGFAWAAQTAQQKIWSNHSVEPFRQGQITDIEFNQDVDYEENGVANYDVGMVVEHATFGRGTIIGMRGDIAEIRFAGGIKNLATSIAPLKIVG